MIEYKKQALERFNLDNKYSHWFKKARKTKSCKVCTGDIVVGDVYFCYEYVYSYLVDHLYDYHLDCIDRDLIVDLLKNEVN